MDLRLRRQDRICHDLTAAEYDLKVTRAFGAHHRLGLSGWIHSHGKAKPARALDEGTGTGVVALELARVCGEVVGLDHSTGMLEVARAKAAQTERGRRVSFVRGDCHRLPFADGTFDVVAIQGMLHHHGSVDWKAAVRESVRVLARGGSLYISEPCVESNPAGRMLAALAGILIRLAGALANPRRVLGRTGPASESVQPEEGCAAVEGSMRSKEVVAELVRLGLSVRTRYLTELPEAAKLSARAGANVIRVVSAPLGAGNGDIVFIYARKGLQG